MKKYFLSSDDTVYDRENNKANDVWKSMLIAENFLILLYVQQGGKRRARLFVCSCRVTHLNFIRALSCNKPRQCQVVVKNK